MGMKIKFGNNRISGIILYMIMLFLQFILLYPEGLTNLSLYNIVRISQNTLFVLMVSVFVLFFIRNRFLRLLFIYFGFLFVATAINKSNYPIILLDASRCFSLCVIYLIVFQNNQKIFLKSISDYFALIAYINTAITILMPNGWYVFTSINGLQKGYYLLGESNQIIPFYLIAVTVAYIWTQYSNKNKMRTMLLMVCTCITEMIYGSATSLLMILLFMLLFLAFNLRKDYIRERISTRKKARKFQFLAVLGIAVVCIGLVFFNIQNLFSYFITSFLHKDITLSTRTVIWSAAVNMIQNSPIYGYGGAFNKYLQVGAYRFNAHNLFLQTMLMGGFVLLILFGAVILLSVGELAKSHKGKTKNVLLCLLLSLSLGSMTEIYTLSWIFVVLFLCYLEPMILYNKEECNEHQTKYS